MICPSVPEAQIVPVGTDQRDAAPQFQPVTLLQQFQHRARHLLL